MESKKNRNDSSQMKAIMNPDDYEDHRKPSPSGSCLKDKPKHFDAQHSNTRESSCSSPSRRRRSSSSSSSSWPQGAANAQVEREERKWGHPEEPQHLKRPQDLKRLPQCNIHLGHLTFSKTHTVLVDVDVYNCEKQLRPQEGTDIWHSNFVKMPCSPSSTITTGFAIQTQEKRWNMIYKQLDKLARKPSVTVQDVAEAIMKYNPKYKGQWSFDALIKFVKRIPVTENYFEALFPKIAALALHLPHYVMKAIPLLQTGQTASITMSQVQIAALLANAFFCTFPHRNTTRHNAEYHRYPSINFTSLFGNWSERKKEKLRAIMHYFHVVTNKDTKLRGLVTFERRCLKHLPTWKNHKRMPKLLVTSHGSIENEGTGMLQVDFASCWIGGGVLSAGLVQEEILFLMNPELIVSRLFTEKLDDNECLIITGSQQFSCYSGFSDSFEWAGPYDDHLKRDEWDRLQRQILAIDALHFKDRREQYDIMKVTRELNKGWLIKPTYHHTSLLSLESHHPEHARFHLNLEAKQAYCGFKGHGHNEPDIATGKWGCGAFNGDPQLKAVIQLMAAAKAERGMMLFSFGDVRLEEGLQQTYNLLVQKDVTVGKLYGLLDDFCYEVQRARGARVDLFEFIQNTVSGHRSQL